MPNLDFNSILGNKKLDIECPKCHHKLSIKLNDVGGSVKCPYCSTKINLEKDNNFDSSVDSVNKSLKDLDDTLKNFGK